MLSLQERIMTLSSNARLQIQVSSSESESRRLSGALAVGKRDGVDPLRKATSDAQRTTFLPVTESEIAGLREAREFLQACGFFR